MEIFRKNTLEFHFSDRSKRPRTYDIHEWLATNLGIHPDTVIGLQLDNMRNSVFVKFVLQEQLDSVLRRTGNEVTYSDASGDIKVLVRDCGDNTKKVRVVNLPFEVPNETIYNELSQYGTIKSVIEEEWSGDQFKFKVKTGVRIVNMVVKRNIPSFVIFKNFKGQVFYEGQKKTCNYCNSDGHLLAECSKRATVQRRVLRPPVLNVDVTDLTMTKLESSTSELNNEKEHPSRAGDTSEEDVSMQSSEENGKVDSSPDINVPATSFAAIAQRNKRIRTLVELDQEINQPQNFTDQ